MSILYRSNIGLYNEISESPKIGFEQLTKKADLLLEINTLTVKELQNKVSDKLSLIERKIKDNENTSIDFNYNRIYDSIDEIVSFVKASENVYKIKYIYTYLHEFAYSLDIITQFTKTNEHINKSSDKDKIIFTIDSNTMKLMNPTIINNFKFIEKFNEDNKEYININQPIVMQKFTDTSIFNEDNLLENKIYALYACFIYDLIKLDIIHGIDRITHRKRKEFLLYSTMHILWFLKYFIRNDYNYPSIAERFRDTTLAKVSEFSTILINEAQVKFDSETCCHDKNVHKIILDTLKEYQDESEKLMKQIIDLKIKQDRTNEVEKN